ncbi:hypothetical protein EWI07_09320 [Sporolactobacillus sp. THM7-4]|nr:hypothetical protein EWI07_09320 [Sporolactobacillus sp. THM7-4]
MINENSLILPYLLLLFLVLPYLNRVSSVFDYIEPNVKFGLHDGTFLLLAHLFKGFFILILFEFIAGHHFIWGALFSIITFLITILFEKFIRYSISVHLNNPNHTGLTFFKDRTGNYAFYVILTTMGLIAFVALMAEITWTTLLIPQVFNLSQKWVLISLLFLLYVYAVVGGLEAIGKVSRVLIFFIFFTIVCLLLYVYLTNGIYSIYHNWTQQKSINQSRLFSKNQEPYMWFLMIPVIFGYLLTNLSLWHIRFCMKENRVKTIYTSAAFCWASLMITLMMIAVYAQTTGWDIPSFVSQIPQEMPHSSTFFISLLVMVVISISLVSSMVGVKSIMDTFLLFIIKNEKVDRSFLKRLYISSLGPVMLLFAILRPTTALLYTCVRIFTALCVVSVPTFLLFVISREKVTMVKVLPLFIGILACLFFFNSPLSPLFSLYLSLLFSLSLQFIIWICQIILHK